MYSFDEVLNKENEKKKKEKNNNEEKKKSYDREHTLSLLHQKTL